MSKRSVLRCIAALLAAALAMVVPGSATAAQASMTSTVEAAPDAGTYVALSPSRILDTRTGNGATGPVAGNGSVVVQVTGRGGVPASGVGAVVLNVTITKPAAGGHVTAYPDGTSRPTASNVNFVKGQTVSNLVVVRVGITGKVVLANVSSGTSQLVADVSGYYTAGAASSPGAFTAVNPSRILDTRTDNGAGGPVPAGGTIHLQVAGRGGVPATGVGAVVMNLTVTRPAASGYVTAYPDGTSQPTASNVNFRSGQTTANVVVATLSSDGMVSITNSSAGVVELVADVAGYFTIGSASAAGTYAGLTPIRTLDTRTGNGASGPVAAGGTVRLQVTGRGGVPAAGVAAVVMNLTVTRAEAGGHLTAYPDGTSAPNTSNLNFAKGQTVANLVVVKVAPNGKVALRNQSPGRVHMVGDIAGYVLTGPCTATTLWSDLAGCGWPGPANSGHPTGQVFAKTVTGGLVVTTDNTVIDGWKISGGVQVRARNVVIRNSLITMNAGGANGSGVVNLNPGSSATIERTTLDGLNATHACVWHEATTMTVSAVDCSHVNDGIFMWATTVGKDGAGDNFVIQDSWLHDFTTAAANGHVDGIQTEGAKHGLIRHNTIDVRQDQTSAVALWNGRKNLDDVRVEGNLIAGGGFSVYAEDYSPSEASPAGGYSVTNVVITGNVFSTVHYGCVGYWGVWFPRGAPTDGWNRSGNIVLETGQNVDKGNPTYQGRTCN